MNAFQRWWNNGDLGSTTIEVDQKSIIMISVIAVVTAFIILLMVKAFHKNLKAA